MYIANVGDCRAVLSRGGVALELSSDQVAARPDELARIQVRATCCRCVGNAVYSPVCCNSVRRVVVFPGIGGRVRGCEHHDGSLCDCVLVFVRVVR